MESIYRPARFVEWSKMLRMSAMEPKMRVALSRYTQLGYRHSYEDLMEWKPMRTKLHVSPLTTVQRFEDFVWRQNLSYTGASDFVIDTNLDMVRVLLVTSDGKPMEGYRKLVHYQVQQPSVTWNNHLQYYGRQMKVNFCVIKRQDEDGIVFNHSTGSRDMDVAHVPSSKEQTLKDSTASRVEAEEIPKASIKQSRLTKANELDACEEVWRVEAKGEDKQDVRTDAFDFELVSKDSGWVEVNSKATADPAKDEDWSAVHFDGNDEAFEASFV